MAIWNELHEPENKHIIGTPGIDYEDDLKGSGRGPAAGQGRRGQGRHELLGGPRACLVGTASPCSRAQESGSTVTDGARRGPWPRAFPCLLAERDGRHSARSSKSSRPRAAGNPPIVESAARSTAVRVTLDSEAQDGRVYHADGEPHREPHPRRRGDLVGHLDSQKVRPRTVPEDDASPNDASPPLREADRRGRHAAAGTLGDRFSRDSGDPFRIPNTFEARAADRPRTGPHPQSDALPSSAWAERVPTSLTLLQKRPYGNSTS